MTPQAYCTERVAPPGSALHYSLRGTATDRRNDIIALHALADELATAAAASHDPGVCSARLHWWHGELERATSDTAQHPVARALGPALRAGRIPAQWLDDLILSSQAEARGLRPPDFAALLAHAHRAGTPITRCTARVLLTSTGASGSRQQTHETAEPVWLEAATTALGAAAWLVAMLRDVGHDARRGRLYLPIDLMQANGVAVAALLAARTGEGVLPGGFKPLLRTLAAATDQIIGDALGHIPTDARRALHPLVALARLQRTLLAEISADPQAVMTGRIVLTPVRMLWITWRAGFGR